eukprot:256565_1
MENTSTCTKIKESNVIENIYRLCWLAIVIAFTIAAAVPLIEYLIDTGWNGTFVGIIFAFFPCCFCFYLCTGLCIFEPFWFANNFGNPKNYNEVASTKQYNNRFRAKLRRTSLFGKTNYNRVISMWTTTKICLLWFTIFDLLSLSYIVSSKTKVSTPVALGFHLGSIFIYIICLRGLYSCNPLFIGLMFILSVIQICFSFYLIVAASAGGYICITALAFFNAYLFYKVYKLSIRYRKALNKEKDKHKKIKQETNSLKIIKNNGSMTMTETTDGVIECKSESTLTTVLGKHIITKGKWYYEVELTNGAGTYDTHIGWSLVTRTEKRSSSNMIGVGTTKEGWAYNPFYKCKCHDWIDTSYGTNEICKDGDRIGCWLDLENKIMRFSSNGDMMGIAFVNFIQDGTEMIPACSIANEGSFTIYFNESQFKYPHEGYKAISNVLSVNESLVIKNKLYENGIKYFKDENKIEYNEEKLPEGWRKAYTKENRVYYQNEVTQETQWHPPTVTVTVTAETNEQKEYEEEKKSVPINAPGALSNESILESIQILSDALAARFNHEGFDINHYLLIHGGACRDALMNGGKNIKDIDLSVDIREIHRHAAKCNLGKDKCALSAYYYTNKNEYIEIWKMFLRSMVKTYYLSASSGFLTRKLHNPEERKCIELMANTILRDFIASEKVINTRYLLKEILND